MKNLQDMLSESVIKPKLTVLDHIYCEYLCRGIQNKAKKEKAIEDLSAMLSTKAHLGESDNFTTRDILCAYLEEFSTVPELFYDENAETLYNYIMSINIKR